MIQKPAVKAAAGALFALWLSAALMSAGGCTLRQKAIGSIAGTLGRGAQTAFSTEGDLELVRQALPGSLKTMEILRAESPDNSGLCLSLARGYMLYAHACIELEAAWEKHRDVAAYRRLRCRARTFYFRAYLYAREALLLSGDMCARLYDKDPEKAVADITDTGRVPYLYWAGAALAKWISLDKTDPGALVRLEEVNALMQHAYMLQPDFDHGALHEFFIASRSGSRMSDADRDRVEYHFERARALAGDKKLSPLLTYVESVSIPQQNRSEFNRYIHRILRFDLDSYPQCRLANRIVQEKARYLKEHSDDLFLGDVP
jgi:hypothetical protein